MRLRSYLLWIGLVLVLSSCHSAQAGPESARPELTNQQKASPVVMQPPPGSIDLDTPTSMAAERTAEPTASPSVSPGTSAIPTVTAPATATIIPTSDPAEWQNLPVIPEVGEAARAIYARGLELGNNPQAFSKIGDCGSTPAWFLGDFDRGPRYYQLGEFQYLEPVIAAFQGSYGRTSLAAKSGFNASSVFATLWADRSACAADETPIACEYRLNRPIMAFITLGSNDVFHQESFEPQMRKIIELSIEQGVIPILATKADNAEKDGSINATIASLAREYGIPLWNFWRAVQPLPDHGLQEDGVHLTWGPNRFDDPKVMTTAWTVRNLTALQTLDAVWRYITDQPPAQP